MSISPADYLDQPEALIVEEAKVTKYLLCLTHPVGGPKAKFFLGLGFTKEDWSELASALREHARHHPVAAVVPSKFGAKYILECFIRNPKGKENCIRVVWNDHLDGNPPKFVTAHPFDR